ncbi:MAG: flagellar biosynthetic protein FlhB [Myxococcota bacterium]|jgi:flagellar biosynthetic protein FlhB
MAENSDGQEKKHDPSEKKWKEAAEKGELPRSQDLSASVILTAGSIALLVAAPSMRDAIHGLWTELFTTTGLPTLDRSEVFALFYRAGRAVLEALVIPFSVLVVAGLVVNLAQTRMQLAPKALTLKWTRLNPLSGFKQNYMSSQPLVELGKGLAKLLLLGGVAYLAIREPARLLPLLATASPADQIRVIGELSQAMLSSSVVVFAGLSIADFSYSYYKKVEDMRMTDKELRDESKERDGDPQFKARRRQRAREIAMGNLLSAVRDADVVITNPTHYAVALKYDRASGHAPIVVAKGVDAIALKLKEEARKAGVPRIENRPLARGLYAKVKMGHPIPEEFYGPVARVLAVVYRKRKRT